MFGRPDARHPGGRACRSRSQGIRPCAGVRFAPATVLGDAGRVPGAPPLRSAPAATRRAPPVQGWYVKAEVPEYAVQDEIYVDPARTALVVIDMQNDLRKAGRKPARAGCGGDRSRDFRPAGARPGERHARRLQPGHPSRGRSRMGGLARALPRGQLGVGDRQPSWRPAPTTPSFGRSATTRSSALRLITCCGSGASTRWSSAAPSRTSPCNTRLRAPRCVGTPS